MVQNGLKIFAPAVDNSFREFKFDGKILKCRILHVQCQSKYSIGNGELYNSAFQTFGKLLPLFIYSDLLNVPLMECFGTSCSEMSWQWAFNVSNQSQSTNSDFFQWLPAVLMKQNQTYLNERLWHLQEHLNSSTLLFSLEIQDPLLYRGRLKCFITL